MLVGDIVMNARIASYVDVDGSVMLLCDGSPVPVLYPALIAMIGANLPQFGFNAGILGSSPIGASPAGGYPVLSTGGVQTHGHAFAGVSLPHAFAAPDTGGPSNFDVVAAGALAVPDAVHTHDAGAPPANHAAIPAPDDAAFISPVLGTGFFIKAA